MGKSRKHTKRGDHYLTMAAGYRVLKSPLADSYHAAAEHYRESDPPRDRAAGSQVQPDRRLEQENGRD
jgi:hypothetical protein